MGKELHGRTTTITGRQSHTAQPDDEGPVRAALFYVSLRRISSFNINFSCRNLQSLLFQIHCYNVYNAYYWSKKDISIDYNCSCEELFSEWHLADDIKTRSILNVGNVSGGRK